MRTNKPYKLLALDVDGTLLGRWNLIARETREALARATERGVAITLATGRGFPSAAGIARRAGIRGPLVTHDGAYVADPATGAVLAMERIPLNVVREAVAILERCHLHPNLLHEQVRISNQRFPEWNSRLLMPNHWADLANLVREANDYPHMYVPNLSAYLAANSVKPPKLYVTGQPKRIAEGRALLEEHLGSVLRTTKAGPTGMEVMLKHVSKASGLKVLAEWLGIGAEEVIAVGDNYNDVEMLRQAGLGVAMGNAPDEVKQAADHVTARNVDHGVARVIEQFVI
ncbi:MAG TPA: Cof-type HAD-IIB family hydrolase [Symbiobacteriaceae bacterium]|jgi:hypothetical protein